jgi:signal transduction histidine kinase
MSDKGLFLIILVSILVVIILAVGVVLLYNVFQSRILKELTEAHDKEIEYKNMLISNSIEVQERERCRIAKDLHDEIGSKLSIVNLNLNLLKGSVVANEKTAKIIDHIEHSLSDSIQETRTISHNLYPPILDKFGIQNALEALSQEITRTGVLKVETQIAHEWKKFDKNEELHIYRIFQELFQNTIKHAEAKNVLISSELKDKKLVLQYKDDGKGLNKEKESLMKAGLGLSSIETRVNLLKGNMNVDENTKRGYKINFEF